MQQQVEELSSQICALIKIMQIPRLRYTCLVYNNSSIPVYPNLGTAMCQIIRNKTSASIIEDLETELTNVHNHVKCP